MVKIKIYARGITHYELGLIPKISIWVHRPKKMYCAKYHLNWTVRPNCTLVTKRHGQKGIDLEYDYI